MVLDLDKVEWSAPPLPAPGEERHYNCFQKVLMPNSGVLGISVEEAERMGSYFGGGMRCGGTCGPVNAALLLLGEIYGSEPGNYDRGRGYLESFAKANGSWLCSDIKDEERKNCNAAVEFTLNYIREQLK